MATRTESRATVRSARLGLWCALGIVYVVWGSTYLAIRVSVEDMPPLLMAGTRFLVAGVIVAAVLAVRHGPGVLRIRPIELRGAAVVGVLLVAGGTGGVVLGERTIASGLAALLVATVPLWVVLLRRVTGDVPRALTWAGVLLGFAGLVVLVLPGEHTGGGLLGTGFVLGAAACWTLGSFLSQRMAMPANPFVGSVWEMLLGGAVLIVVAVVRGERPASGSGGLLDSYATESWLALAYLIVFGSLVAYTAYVWLLQNAALSLVATYAYVNPVVAVVLGALILDEAITAPIVVGGAIVVIAVALVVTAERPPATGTADVEPVA